MKEILGDLLKNLTSNQWRIRESSCYAVTDLLRGRQLDSIVEDLPELWEQCLRVRDDIKVAESVNGCVVGYIVFCLSCLYCVIMNCLGDAYLCQA